MLGGSWCSYEEDLRWIQLLLILSAISRSRSSFHKKSALFILRFCLCFFSSSKLASLFPFRSSFWEALPLSWIYCFVVGWFFLETLATLCLFTRKFPVSCGPAAYLSKADFLLISLFSRNPVSMHIESAHSTGFKNVFRACSLRFSGTKPLPG